MKYLVNILLMAAMSVFAACGSSFPQEGGYPYVPGDEEQGGEVQPDPEPDLPGETCKILFIGNSLTLDATTLLPDMLNAAGVKNVEMTRIFHVGRSGCRVHENLESGRGEMVWGRDFQVFA